MNRIDKLFSEKNSNILSVFYTAGYPNLNDTLPVLSELQEQGVDMVELGIPFSDPMADGVVIQNAATKALSNGMSLSLLFEQIEGMRGEIKIPVVLMGYLNPIMYFGFENFCKKCAEVGVDGVIIPDLPFHDYLTEYKAIAEAYKIKMIMFITPNTSTERIKLIDEHSSGFIYMVSSAGITGAKQSFEQSQQEYFTKINSMQLKHPRLIGFGVSNGDTFKAACKHSSGAIVGSYFVKILGGEGSLESKVGEFLRGLL